MKFKLLFILLIFVTTNSYSVTCSDVSNEVNKSLINQINKKIEKNYNTSDIFLTRTFCDKNSNGESRLNYSYDVNNHDYISSEGRQNLVKEFCSNEQIKILWGIVTEIKYHYFKEGKKKMAEMSFFENTCK
tara:strand:- start:264 stop:656 length:393 start_codon:yes stop_codon:yes gene_type:complete